MWEKGNPKNDGTYIICTIVGRITAAKYEEGKWTDIDNNPVLVGAWMQLPMPPAGK